MRNAIDRVVEECNMDEKDASYQWELAVIDVTKRPLASSRNFMGYPTAVEITQIRVIVRRSLKPGAVAKDSQAAKAQQNKPPQQGQQQGQQQQKPNLQGGQMMGVPQQQGNQQRLMAPQGQMPQQMQMGQPIHPDMALPMLPHPHHSPQGAPQPIHITNNNNNAPGEKKNKKTKKQKQHDSKRLEYVEALRRSPSLSSDEDSDIDRDFRRGRRHKPLPGPRMSGGLHRSSSPEQTHRRGRRREPRRHHDGINETFDEFYGSYYSDSSDSGRSNTPPTSISDTREFRSSLRRRPSHKFSGARGKSRGRSERGDLLRRHSSVSAYAPRSRSFDRGRAHERLVRSRKVYREELPPPVLRDYSRSPLDQGPVVARAYTYEALPRHSFAYDDDELSAHLSLTRRPSSRNLRSPLLRSSDLPPVPMVGDSRLRRMTEPDIESNAYMNEKRAYMRGRDDGFYDAARPQFSRADHDGRRLSEHELWRARRTSGRFQDLDFPDDYAESEDFYWRRDGA